MRHMIIPLAAGALAAGGCYAYQPVDFAGAPPGRAVRVMLNDAGRRDLATIIGPEVEWVTGDVTAADSAHVTLRVVSLQRTGGIEEAVQLTTPVVISRADVATLGIRRVAAARSALVAGVVGAGAFAIGHSIGGDQNGSRPGNSGNPTPK